MTAFVGRARELEKLEAALNAVRETGGARFVSVRGRRQVGKSRLVEELIERSGVKAVFYVASQLPADAELEAFRTAIAASPTAAAEVAAAGPLGSWQAGLTLLANEATTAEPLIVVIDELPYLTASTPSIEGILQTVWDRTLERKAAVLLITIGSDLATMEALGTYGRLLYNRAEELTVDPLSPAETSEMLSLEAHDALDAHLVLGGFPRLMSRWQKRDTLWRFLRRELANPESPLLVMGERTLASEFPADLKGQSVIRAIGAGERTFSGILQRTDVSQSGLAATLESMSRGKRVVDRALPYSATPRPKLARYLVSDAYLRFWLRFLDRNLPTVQRGRGDVVVVEIEERWPAYRGQAIEPIVRRAIERLLPDERFGRAMFVGGYWNRDSSIEVDVVGGREVEAATEVDFIGSIKWRERSAFDRADLAHLSAQRGDVPGATGQTRLVGISRSGFDTTGLDVQLTPEDILAAWR
ncbi:MAG: ATP-binding protein [Gaiellales bacterium]